MELASTRKPLEEAGDVGLAILGLELVPEPINGSDKDKFVGSSSDFPGRNQGAERLDNLSCVDP